MESNEIGKFILKLRKDNNLTQREFADMFGVTYQAVSKWENGKNIPDIILLKEIGNQFNISIDNILNGERLEKKRLNITLVFFGILILSIIILLVINQNKKNDFQFKAISSSCTNFNIKGSVAYNHQKSHIYISDITYCGGDDVINYNQIECILYESKGNIDKRVDSYVTKENFNNTLEFFLQNLHFYIDNSKDSFKGSDLYLQVNATDKSENTISYKIPLKFSENITK